MLKHISIVLKGDSNVIEYANDMLKQASSVLNMLATC